MNMQFGGGIGRIDAHVSIIEYTHHLLIIDPITLNWSTFFHTSLSDDYVISTYQDTAGYIYTTGYSKAVDFPVTPGVYQDSIGGNLDVFVSKFYPGGGSLVYNTFIGGISWELGYGLAAIGRAHV